MHHNKMVVLIADGLGDRPCPPLGGLTPLQKAHTPSLDEIAAKGICGIMDLLSPGIPVGTDMGHLILFGGHEHEYPGRGPIEACGINMPIEDGDVLFRCNFATVDNNGIVLDRRAGRINVQTEELTRALDGMCLGNGITAHITPATEHRAVLILRGSQLSDRVGDTDPKQAGICSIAASAKNPSPEAQKTAAALAHFLEQSHIILKGHAVNSARAKNGLLPANFLLTRGAGLFTSLASAPLQYGFKGCCVAAESTVLGIARLKGYDTVTHSALTGGKNSDFSLKVKLALEALQTHDLVFVHVKAPDLAGHDNRPLEKIEAIECVNLVASGILQQLPPHTYVALAADHSTPCEVQEHSGDPVPIAVWGKGVRTDHVTRFNEIECAHGGMGRISGKDFFATIIDYMGCSIKKGN